MDDVMDNWKLDGGVSIWIINWLGTQTVRIY